MAAAVATWIVARGPMLTRVLEKDREWGTTTVRPRLLTWLRSFIDASGRAGVMPVLRALAEALREQLGRRWPEAAVPDYPALAGPWTAWRRRARRSPGRACRSRRNRAGRPE